MLLSHSCLIVSRENIEILKIDNALASAEIALFGGHMLSFIPKHSQRERFWLSKAALLDGKHAIRGGVPVCWPWFGDHEIKRNDPANTSLQAHGYVRAQQWKIVSSSDSENGTQVRLKPSSSEGDGFTGEAELTMILEIGKHCSMQLLTANKGKESFTYTCALHSYFAVKDIYQCMLTGLGGNYLDKTRGMEIFDTPSPYIFREETDRVHLCQPALVIINDQAELTEIHSKGHDSMVVWNPWQAKSVSMKDMEDDGYLSMLCVETAVTQGQVVAPGETHILQQVVS